MNTTTPNIKHALHSKGIKKTRIQPTITVWHFLFVLGLAVQVFIFYRSENACYPQDDLGSFDTESANDIIDNKSPENETRGSEQSSLSAVLLATSLEGSSDLKFPPVSNSCRLEVIGGREPDGYGAWTLCSDRLSTGGIVYSFGIGGDVSFDNDLIERGLLVYGFDPTITTDKVKGNFKRHGVTEIPKEFIFKQLGLAATDGVVTFFQSKNPKIQSKTAVDVSDLKVNYQDGGFQAAVLQLKTFMCMFDHKFLQVLKMDVEGVELDVCLSESFRNWNLPFDQILIEFHERMMKSGQKRKDECILVLKSKGFHIVHVSKNKQELAFARMSPTSKVLNPHRVIQTKTFGKGLKNL